jgi:hypothetical protein
LCKDYFSVYWLGAEFADFAEKGFPDIFGLNYCTGVAVYYFLLIFAYVPTN